MMIRRPDWKVRLITYLADARSRPHQWGTHDCALFTAGCVAAMTGVDIAADLRGYSTLNGGLKRVRKSGFKDHVDVFAQALPPVPVLMAQPGDVAVVAGDPGDAVGIVQGAMIYLLGPDGLGLAPVTRAKKAFRV